jgi:hypothetical protein
VSRGIDSPRVETVWCVNHKKPLYWRSKIVDNPSPAKWPETPLITILSRQSHQAESLPAKLPENPLYTGVSGQHNLLINGSVLNSMWQPHTRKNT